MQTRFLPFAALLTAVATTACSENTAGRVTLALSSGSAPGGALTAHLSAAGNPAGARTVAAAGDSVVIALGDDTLIIRSVEVVLRDIELEKVEVADCDAIAGNDDCEEFESGPVLVSLPLGAATEVAIAIDAPAGMYDELEFRVHKPDELDDAPFIAANPLFADHSIRVSGTFSQAGARTDFTFMSDLNDDQEVVLAPPLTVSEGNATTVTLRLDVSTWFLSGDQTALVDPATANNGGVNENVVRDNIRASIDAFRDEDRDGRDDDDSGSAPSQL